MVRGVSKRRITRREYSLCVLETCYAPEVESDAAESAEPVKREREDGFRQSPRSVCGDQPVAYGEREIEKGAFGAKRRRVHDRCSFNDAWCSAVFRNVGSDLIAPWLTPVEFRNVRVAANVHWSWARVWHGGRVFNKALSAFIAAKIHNNEDIDYLFQKYPIRDIFSALIYILPVEQYIGFVNKYKYVCGLKKLL